MPTTVKQILTGPQFAAISDFTNLYLEFSANTAQPATPGSGLSAGIGLSAIIGASFAAAAWSAPGVGASAVVGSTGAYVGPGDIISGAAAYFGLRAYTVASIGGNVVTLRRSSDNTQKTFVSLSDGSINTADAFFNGSTYTVVTLYDQTGNGNDINQSTAAVQPLFFQSGPGGKPYIQFVTSGTLLIGKTGFGGIGSQPTSGSAVFNNTGGAGNVAFWVVNDGVGGNSAYNVFGVDSPSAGQVYMYAGSVFAVTCSTSAWHSIQGLFNGSSSTLMLDGTSNTGGAVGAQPGGPGQLVMGDAQLAGGAGTSFNGLLTEAMWWSGDKSASFGTLTTNQRAYWGF